MDLSGIVMMAMLPALVPAAFFIHLSWSPDWRRPKGGNSMVQLDILRLIKKMTLVDSLDVAILDDERKHALKWWEGAVVPGFPAEVRQIPYQTQTESVVLDGGRLLTGGITFYAATEPGMELTIIGRFHTQDPATLDVTVNGQYVGEWRYPANPGKWLESAFRVPAVYVTGNQPQIQIVLSEENPPEFKFEPYYFWFWQGPPNNIRTTPQYQMQAQFAGGLLLTGYDIDLRQFHPAGLITIQFYWRSEVVNDIDAILFIHFFDEYGDLVAQLRSKTFSGHPAAF